MRVDYYLKKVRLIKTREGARKACNLGYVFINGKKAKPAAQVKPGDEILLDMPTRKVRVEVVELPQGNVRKKDAPSYYRLIESERKAPHIQEDFWESIEE
ncbi:MAG TPA: hypothetical protein ENG67_06450 [candidate division WOR-3 bacterium]|uniref:RNA-binding S4 domain-containing protein n=1 Tax=candidate division WOR-3 bacterium TaxID=2052148 RepID=A0A7C0XBU9_UNCW3|nr:hypothetical protein [Candidatus Hydrothermae bacterium]HDM90827.1 hypothetical protein [candidate division WOR-3 bacterium]